MLKPNAIARPFLKWAGGKRQLLAQFADHYPRELATGEIVRVVEPFVGSGAVFLHIAQHYPVREIVLNDANPEIFRIYSVLQRAPDRLIESLQVLQSRYLALDEAPRRAFYYNVRARYNAQRHAPGMACRAGHGVPDVWVQRAAWTVFLNKTCFNGLYRVNAKGEFNVPFGRYARPVICDVENLQAVARILQHAEILSGDYSLAAQWIDERTLVYFDPPYRPLSSTAAFTTYAPGGFNDGDQTRLAHFFARLHRETRARLMLSNSDPANVNPADGFFDELYRGFNIHRVQASRSINSQGGGRGKITELLITNY